VNDLMNLRGHVKIFKVHNNKRELIVDKNNLIVYIGREWILPKIVNTDNVNISPTIDLFISWISFGKGGAPVNSPLDPIPPASTDIGLNSEHIIGDINTYADGGKKKAFDSIEFIQDDLNANRYLGMRISSYLDESELVDQDINEAGLWLSDSNNVSTATEFHLFSKTTFATVRKQSNFALHVLWYIYS